MRYIPVPFIHATGREWAKRFRNWISLIRPTKVNEYILKDDEIVRAKTYFHMERMSDGHIWFTIGDEAFDLYAVGGKLTWRPQRHDEWEGIADDETQP